MPRAGALQLTPMEALTGSSSLCRPSRKVVAGSVTGNDFGNYLRKYEAINSLVAVPAWHISSHY